MREWYKVLMFIIIAGSEYICPEGGATIVTIAQNFRFKNL
jgi:hypothetical protein